MGHELCDILRERLAALSGLLADIEGSLGGGRRRCAAPDTRQLAALALRARALFEGGYRCVEWRLLARALDQQQPLESRLKRHLFEDGSRDLDRLQGLEHAIVEMIAAGAAAPPHVVQLVRLFTAWYEAEIDLLESDVLQRAQACLSPEQWWVLERACTIVNTQVRASQVRAYLKAQRPDAGVAGASRAKSSRRDASVRRESEIVALVARERGEWTGLPDRPVRPPPASGGPDGAPRPPAREVAVAAP